MSNPTRKLHPPSVDLAPSFRNRHLRDLPLVLTFLTQLRPTNTVRRSSLISALLILTLSASVSTCITGSSDGASPNCRVAHVRLNYPQAGLTAGDQCGDTVRARAKQCSLRGMLQFQFLTLPSAHVAPPLQVVAEYKTPPVDSTIKFTSTGSPETDRGPPLS